VTERKHYLQHRENASVNLASKSGPVLMLERNFLVRFKEPLTAPMLIRALRVETQGEHLVFLRADGRLAALFLLEIVKDWEDLQV
jgi:hypothetical protein